VQFKEGAILMMARSLVNGFQHKSLKKTAYRFVYSADLLKKSANQPAMTETI